MNDDDDLEAMAYVDGELDAAGTRAFEARLAADSELARRVAQQGALRRKVRAAYAPVLEEAVSERLTALVAARPADAGAVVELDRVRAERRSRGDRRRPSWPEWAALAAAVVFGVSIGLAWRPWGDHGAAGNGEPLLAAADGGWVARGALDAALTHRLAADPAAAHDLRVGLSFLARDGHFCRAFTTDGAQASAGLACRNGDVWRLELVARSEGGVASDASFRPAASAWPPALLQAVEARRAGDLLDAGGERSARERDWRR